jgi:hypothetical protein
MKYIDILHKEILIILILLQSYSLYENYEVVIPCRTILPGCDSKYFQYYEAYPGVFAFSWQAGFCAY